MAEIDADQCASWLEKAVKNGLLSGGLLRGDRAEGSRDIVWPDSVQKVKGTVFCLVRLQYSDALLAEGPERGLLEGTDCSCCNKTYRFCPLTHSNAEVLRNLFPFTAPSRILEEKTTFGLGDRLGMASPGHIRTLKKNDVYPVFSQQSVRELELTGRTYAGAVDAASWAVFQEGYRKPWGADGDHIKSAEWVKRALDEGCTMITVDLSDHIRSEYEAEDADVSAAYGALDLSFRKRMEKTYLRKKVHLDTGDTIDFKPDTLRRIMLIYQEAVDTAVRLYETAREVRNTFDFEISLDETASPTLPEAHVFVVEELKNRGVDFQTLAPRFVGEFQKGIDYRGDIGEFKKTFSIHSAIARHYGHRLSIHSGSDKFSVFPFIGNMTMGTFHLKTSGTNWLQALYVIADTEPDLFRRIFKFSLERFSVTRTYYVITPDLDQIDDVDTLDDQDLSSIIDNVHSRQVIHVSYGEILKNQGLRTRLFEVLRKHRERYYSYLGAHLEHHFSGLGLLERG